MLYDTRFEKAMQMLNRQLQEMKKELLEVKEMHLKKKEEKIVKCMEAIYRQIEEMIKKFLKTESQEDLNSVCRALEALQPAFILNYNEVCYEQDLKFLNQGLEEIALEIEQVEHLSLKKREDLDFMKKMYEELLVEIDQYAQSHDRNDFKKIFEKMERQKPEFVLNYKKFKT